MLEKLKLKYTAPQWKEREELVQSGKALAVDGFPYDKLFGNDKAENGSDGEDNTDPAEMNLSMVDIEYNE